VDFAAEQAGEFAADGKAETGAAVFAAGRGVGLLERLEDDALLRGLDADAGVADLEMPCVAFAAAVVCDALASA
jgi:hypothetical protein